MSYISYVVILLVFNQIITIRSQFNDTEIVTTILPSNISISCKLQLGGVFSSLNQKWAMQMIDATAKPQAGLLYGNIMHMGNYDECLEIDEQTEFGRIQGKYCSAFYSPHPVHGQNINSLLDELMPETAKIQEDNFLFESRKSYGFCVPKICSVPDLQTLTNLLENYFNFSLHFTFVDDFCDSADVPDFTSGAIAAIVVFSLFAFLILFASLYDVFVYSNLELSKQTPNLLIAFSAVTNTRRLLSTKAPTDTLGCLNGLRVISLMWIVLDHGYEYLFWAPQTNTVILDSWKTRIESSIPLAGSMAVDTFFTISGLLVAYLFLKSKSKGAKFNLLMFYVHRILRLTPSLAMVVLFVSTLLPYMNKGPLWIGIMETFYKPCQDQWWKTIIYLSNYLSITTQCVGHAWYLAVDTQMYFLSPLILFPLAKWPKKTIISLLVLITLNCAYVFQVTASNRLGVLFFTQDDEQTKYLYTPTHIRGTVYVIGMISGYFIFRTKQNRLKLSRLQVLMLWVFSILAMFGIVLGHSYFAREDFSRWDAAVFNSLSRVSWAFALSVLIVLCTNNYGGIINTFLSHDIFTVLIRLNYNIYLLHLILMAIIVGGARIPAHFGDNVAYSQFWGYYMFSVGAAFVWTLAFESPIIVIEQVLFAGNKRKGTTEVIQNTRNGKNEVSFIETHVIDNGSYQVRVVN